MSAREDDKEFEEFTIDSVKGDRENGWSIGFDGYGFRIPATSPIEPKVGITIRQYGRGFGYMVRGCFLDGVEVYYRTPEQEEEHHKKEIEAQHERDRATFEKNRVELDARVAKLPQRFQERLEKFRSNNPDFRWKYEGYELFCCEEAVKIATALKTPDAVKAFGAMEWEQQRAAVPDISDGHSGNTFGCAVRLAYLSLSDQPENVVRVHGALAPLVGSKEYGCVPKEQVDGDAETETR